MQAVLLEIRYFETELSKSLKKFNFNLFLNPVPFNEQSFQTENGSGTSDQLIFRLRNKFRKIP